MATGSSAAGTVGSVAASLAGWSLAWSLTKNFYSEKTPLSRLLVAVSYGFARAVRRFIVKFHGMNAFVLRHIKIIEMIGVLMRVFSFSLVSWLGPKSPFMFVWIFNTTDALVLTWCSTLKRDTAYMVLNAFWILVGLVGILRAGNLVH